METANSIPNLALEVRLIRPPIYENVKLQVIIVWIAKRLSATASRMRPCVRWLPLHP